MIERLGRLDWLGLVPAYGVGLVGTATALALMARFPGESILDYSPRVLGAAAGRAFLVLLGLMLLFGAPLNLNFMSRVVQFTELPRMPLLVPAWLLAALVGYACYFGPEVVARVAEVVFWPLAFGFLFIFVVPLAAAVPARLLPLSGFPWAGYLTAPVASSLGTVRGFLCLLVLGGAARESGRGMATPAVLALSASWVLLVLGLALPVMVLGVGFAEHIRYPIVAVSGTVSFRWFPFQRLTLILGLVWEMVMYVVLGFYLWSGTYVLCAALGTTRWRSWIIAGAAVTGATAGLPVPPALAERGVDGWNFAVVAIGVLGPLLLFAVARARGHAAARRGAEGGHAA
jgi:hypothetical protein